MEDSHLKLKTWLIEMWLIGNAKNGISSYEIHRALGITQKTAWYLSHRIRELMGPHTLQKLFGIVEADDTFIGGKEANKHSHKKRRAGRGAVGKAVVFGLMQRHGEVLVRHVPDTKRQTLQAEIRAHVKPGATMFTDSLPSYEGLNSAYVHESINHAEAYVRGEVHTNHLENFWCHFKRCFNGTWTHLSDPHLPGYLNEEAFRYNNLNNGDGGRFAMLVGAISGKHLTYETLIERGLTTMLRK